MWLPKFIRRWLVLRQVREHLRSIGLPEGVVMQIMGGWKVWTGAIGMIVSGVGLIAMTIAADEFDWTKIMAGIALIGKGLEAIGQGHKVEKEAAKTRVLITNGK